MVNNNLSDVYYIRHYIWYCSVMDKSFLQLMMEFINNLTDPQIFLIMVLGSIGAAWTIFLH